jgi:2-hydroxy-3-keto-5-methylthiopentenyl-1-phosphate phosphatase
MNIGMEAASFNAVQKLGLEPGQPVGLTDLDTTIYKPDGYGFMVENFSRDPEAWYARDRDFNLPGSNMTCRDLFQHAFDLCQANEGFKLESVLASLQAIHQKLAGTENLAALFAVAGIPMIAVSNGLHELAGPLLEHHGLNWPLIANHATMNGNKKYVFNSLHGENGVDKSLIADTLIAMGHPIVCGFGDSRSDIGLVTGAIKCGGFGLARRHLGLARWCETNVEADSWRSYDVFDQETLAWISDKLTRWQALRPTAVLGVSTNNTTDVPR